MVHYMGLVFMLAILYSWGTKPKMPTSLRGKTHILALSLLVLWAASTCAQEDPHPTTVPQKPDFASHAEKAFQTAKTRYESDKTNPEAAWQFGRACYDWAEFAKSNSEREEIAQQGINACRNLLAHNPRSVEGHYYLALNLGQLARARKLEALKLVEPMETEFKTVLNMDPKLDYAGADRGLGLLYLNVPRWPLSIGNKAKARQHLQKAEKLFPNFPENILNLVEAYLKWNDKKDAIRELKKLDEIWPAARKEFSGEQWASTWADWEGRREMFRNKA